MIFTVAVDGPAASGKGTISRQISEYFGFSYLDTGLIYRYIGSKVLGGMSPFQALSEGKMMQIIVFSLLVGIAIVACGDKANPVAAFFKSSSK